MQVAALVLGIVSLVLSLVPCLGAYALLVAVPGIVFSCIGFSKAKRTGEKSGFATAGLVMSIIALAISLFQAKAASDTADALDDVGKALEEMDGSLKHLD